MLDYRPSYSGQRNPVNPECPLSGRGGGRPRRTSVPARLPLTPPCMKHSKRSGQGSGRARHRLQVSTSHATGAQGSVRVSGRTWRGGGACGVQTTRQHMAPRGSMWVPDNSRQSAVLPQSLGKTAVTLTRFVKTNAAQTWLTGCEQLGWGLQRQRAPLLEAAFVSQAPRGRAASLQMPFSRGPRALLCLEWDTEAGRGVLITNRSFPCEQISTVFPKGVSLEAWNF